MQAVYPKSCFFFSPPEHDGPFFESRPHQPESHQQREDRSDEWKKSNNSWNCHSLRFQATQVFVCLSWTAGARQSQAAALAHRLFGIYRHASSMRSCLPVLDFALAAWEAWRRVNVCPRATAVIPTGPPSVNNSVSQWHKANQHRCQLFRDSRQHGFPLVINRCLVIYELFH